jgi:hypothetical protein
MNEQMSTAAERHDMRCLTLPLETAWVVAARVRLRRQNQPCPAGVRYTELRRTPSLSILAASLGLG